MRADTDAMTQGKKHILIIYESLTTGGSTTSLINLLSELDHSRYEVDLITYRNENIPKGIRLPEQVNLLNGAAFYGNSPLHRLTKAAILSLSPQFHRAMRAKRKKQNKYVVLQYMSYARVRISRPIRKNYRAAIAFVEGWSASYLLSDKIKADKKLVFIHLDYRSAGTDPDIDRKAFGVANALITVSESCRLNLIQLYPEYADKIFCIENLHSPKRMRRLADEADIAQTHGRFDFLTVCRPDIYVKGLDRLLDAATALKEKGYRFRWGILGVNDSPRFRELFSGYGLSGYVIPFESVENPYPFYKATDRLVVTSRTEAKPMTVTEAQILGVPCIVTEYSSAHEQIRNGIDGVITENSLKGITDALQNALEHPEELEKQRMALKEKSFDFSRETEKLYSLIDG
ncbi:MAG: glycosyltransferase [Clostridia bacterium]|nr:glycosyltransferase [Clostridia bacterium]